MQNRVGRMWRRGRRWIVGGGMTTVGLAVVAAGVATASDRQSPGRMREARGVQSVSQVEMHMLAQAAKATPAGPATSAARAGASDQAGSPDDAAAPVITEVLFNVPTGDADPNGDGVRSSTGDEFVEIVNPGAAPLSLKGWTLTSRLSTGDPDAKRGVRFTFPDVTLPPRAAAVVFNGFGWTPPPGVGGPDRAPAGPLEAYGGAFVLSMETEKRNRAFANGGDFVLLTSPDGRPVEAIVWGEPDPAPPPATARVWSVKANPKGSVARQSVRGAFEPHRDLDEQRWSPGRLVAATSSDADG